MGQNSKSKRRLALTVVVVALLTAVPGVLDPETSYVVFLLFSAFIYVALAQAWNLVSGYTGQVSLGNHAFFGLGAYVIAIGWSRGLIGYLDPLGMLLAGCAAAILGILVGIPLLSKLRGDYFALGTLGLGEILRLVTIQGRALTAGPTGIFLPSSSFTTIVPYYFMALFLALLATGVTYYMVKSNTGLALVATRDDEAAAAAIGINILKFKVLAFAVGAFLAGLCGALQAYYVFHVEPQGFFSLSWTIYPVLMCVLGGVGTLTGPVVGAVFLTAAFEVAKYYLPEIHPIFSGLLIILVIMFLPNGLVRLRRGRIVRNPKAA
ncbi:MAG: branched-chain amino acid ABC transporter permease [Desulfobacterales bacterium]|nr:MAG: branched-chain amino acid ABC transporter permease [Desulfobacterales bacterium]